MTSHLPLSDARTGTDASSGADPSTLNHSTKHRAITEDRPYQGVFKFPRPNDGRRQYVQDLDGSTHTHGQGHGHGAAYGNPKWHQPLGPEPQGASSLRQDQGRRRESGPEHGYQSGFESEDGGVLTPGSDFDEGGWNYLSSDGAPQRTAANDHASQGAPTLEPDARTGQGQGDEGLKTLITEVHPYEGQAGQLHTRQPISTTPTSTVNQHEQRRLGPQDLHRPAYQQRQAPPMSMLSAYFPQQERTDALTQQSVSGVQRRPYLIYPEVYPASAASAQEEEKAYRAHASSADPAQVHPGYLASRHSGQAQSGEPGVVSGLSKGSEPRSILKPSADAAERSSGHVTFTTTDENDVPTVAPLNVKPKRLARASLEEALMHPGARSAGVSDAGTARDAALGSDATDTNMSGARDGGASLDSSARQTTSDGTTQYAHSSRVQPTISRAELDAILLQNQQLTEERNRLLNERSGLECQLRLADDQRRSDKNTILALHRRAEEEHRLGTWWYNRAGESDRLGSEAESALRDKTFELRRAEDRYTALQDVVSNWNSPDSTPSALAPAPEDTPWGQETATRMRKMESSLKWLYDRVTRLSQASSSGPSVLCAVAKDGTHVDGGEPGDILYTAFVDDRSGESAARQSTLGQLEWTEHDLDEELRRDRDDRQQRSRQQRRLLQRPDAQSYPNGSMQGSRAY